MRERDIRALKKRFTLALSPFFEMLGNLYNEMNFQDWLAMVRKMEASFVNNPTQYLGNDIPGEDITQKVLEESVSDFLSYYTTTTKKEVSTLN